MKHFTLLIFNDTDEVIETKSLGTATLASARMIAEKIMIAHPSAAGYQLWRKGSRLFTSYPHPSEVATPIAMIAMNRANGRARKIRRG